MSHDAHQPQRAHSDPDVPVSQGVSPMAKALMALALLLIFIQGGLTVGLSWFGRLPPTEAVKVPLGP
jgi:hypothetical protein